MQTNQPHNAPLTSAPVDGILAAIVFALALVIVGAGCGGDSSDSHDTVNSITNSIDASIGIDLPDRADQVAPGLYAWLDGDGNQVLFDITTGASSTNPVGVVVLGVKGDDNQIQVIYRQTEATEPAEEAAE
jgi:hypothetical protein